MFFSFPHIAIDSDGKVGAVSRPNRPGASAACGALIAVSEVGLTCVEGYPAALNCKERCHALPPGRPPAHCRRPRLYCPRPSLLRPLCAPSSPH